MSKTPITHALLSVSDKTGIVELARGLKQAGITLLSTGGTAKTLKENKIPVIDIEEFTGFPEMMGGRVKTLHPKLYAGILARQGIDDEILKQQNYELIGLVVVNLYPFKKVTQVKNCTFATAIENIDIGGPTLLRAAAKNFERTTVVVDVEDYAKVLDEIKQEGATSAETRFELAKKVFTHVADYDAAISNYFSYQDKNAFPETYTLQLHKKIDLRYGENPHQLAAFYALEDKQPLQGNISTAKQHVGKPLSYNNIGDADAAIECVRQFKNTACVIVKHANPCAVALGENTLSAYETAFNADKTSAFGGIIAFNAPLDVATLEKILTNQFVEVIIAPEITEEALKLTHQKPNIRILTVGDISMVPNYEWEYKSVNGGILIQYRDNQPTPSNFDVVTLRQPNSHELEDLLFAWQVVRFVKSNAIVYAKNQATVGIGPGQTSRIFSSKIAAQKAEEAGLSLKGSVMASDAFFPFRDSVEEAAQLGISAIIQPRGSIRDKEIIEAADENNIAMIFTGMRHFRH